LVVLIAASWWYLTSGRYVSTDDAYVQAARTMISTDVAGRVIAVLVHDNQRVAKGDVMFQLDDRPYRIAVEEAQAQLASARLQIEPGTYVTASTPVFSMMSDWIWVEANFKETELTHMRPGQDATVEIDTYPDAVCHGKVISLSPGTGLSFSLLPPENATGNWVKVVQRLPVRLALECSPSDLPLQAGLSASVEIDTKHRRPWLAWVQRTTDRLFGTAQAGEAPH